MKKVLDTYKLYMVRPIMYQAVTRFSAGLVLALLWDRYINTGGVLSVKEHAFFILGIFLIGLAWFDFLRFDGMRLHHMSENGFYTQKKKKHNRRDIVDFVDEKIISFDDLEYDEQSVCRLSADLLVGAVFMGLSLIAF